MMIKSCVWRSGIVIAVLGVVFLFKLTDERNIGSGPLNGFDKNPFIKTRNESNPKDFNNASAESNGVANEIDVLNNNAKLVNENNSSYALFAPQEVPGRIYNYTAKDIEQRSDGNLDLDVHLKTADFLLDKNYYPVPTQDNPYLLLQLRDPISRSIKHTLSQYGVLLEDYVPNNTWEAEVPTNVLHIIKDLSFVYAIGEIAAEDKFNPHTIKNGFSDYSYNSDGTVTLHVLYRRNTDLAKIEDQLALLDGTINDKNLFNDFNLLIVNLPEDRVLALAQYNKVKWIENGPAPIRANNQHSAEIVGVTQVQVQELGLQNFLDGNGVTVGVWDEGLADLNHIDFKSIQGDTRIKHGDTDDVTPHATHVSGTIAGSGIGDYNLLFRVPAGFELQSLPHGQSKGIAYASRLVSFNIEDRITELEAAYSHGIVTTNHSYEIAIGWTKQQENGKWIWFDNTHEFGNYSSAASMLLDQVVQNNPYLNLVFAAGNSRGVIGAANHGHDSWWCEWCVYSDSHQPDGGAYGYDTIGPNGVAKNVITVGAFDRYNNDTWEFSSSGPVDDGRIKPDVIAPGVNLRSTLPDNQHGTMTGTSMAAPIVTGSTALIIQRYRQIFNKNPLASTVKAYVIHSAKDLGSPGPDYRTGWGLLDVKNAIQCVENGSKSLFVNRFYYGLTETNNRNALDSNQVNSYAISVDDTLKVLKVTLVWSDDKGNPIAAKALVADLDLELISPTGIVHFPWILDKNNPSQFAARGKNHVDNVEQVVVIDPEAGVWGVKISYTVLDSDQEYSLVTNAVLLGEDSDNDFISDNDELAFGSDPYNADTDGDGLSDFDEVCFDGDCRNYNAYPNGSDTDLNNPDTDGDDMSDYDEIMADRNPILNDPVLVPIINLILLKKSTHQSSSEINND